MILNQTKNIILSKREKHCNTLFSQARGLMFSPRKNLVMKFKSERKISLHNFFVFYPIDVLILNEKKKVVEIKENFLPFTFWKAGKRGKYVVELGEEESKRKVRVGDILKIVI